MPGLLGMARRSFARARLHDDRRGRNACADERADRVWRVIKVAIVGAGPAGSAAADVLATHGAAVTMIDEGREAGGQIYRRARSGLKLDVDTLLGSEAANYRNFHVMVD